MNINELEYYEIPKIKLTQSINHSINTVIFIFSSLQILNLFQNKKIHHLSIKINNVWIESDTVHINFKHGKPATIFFIFVLKNRLETINFITFLKVYAKKTQLNFIKK